MIESVQASISVVVQQGCRLLGLLCVPCLPLKKNPTKQTNRKKKSRSQHRKPCLMLLVSCFPPSLGHSVVCGSCKFRKMKVSGRAAVQAASLIWIGVLDATYSQADCSGSAWNRRRPLPCEDLGWTIALEVKQLPFLLRRPRVKCAHRKQRQRRVGRGGRV